MYIPTVKYEAMTSVQFLFVQSWSLEVFNLLCLKDWKNYTQSLSKDKMRVQTMPILRKKENND